MKISILGCGNLGRAMALGLTHSKKHQPENITVTRKRIELLRDLELKGYQVTTDNVQAAETAEIIILAVRPQQMVSLLEEIKPSLKPQKQIIFSAALNVTISDIRKILGKQIKIVRVMPNIAVEICESMTCLAFDGDSEETLSFSLGLFKNLGETMVIEEGLMNQATVLCACGVAFFLRSIRAASQGGVEIGFHAEEAIKMAAQTAKGSAALLLASKDHPEVEIDKVTTPSGITIKGLNHMESLGFSAAMVAGIKLSAEKGVELLKEKQS